MEKQLGFLRKVHSESGSILSPRELAAKMAHVWFETPRTAKQAAQTQHAQVSPPTPHRAICDDVI